LPEQNVEVTYAPGCPLALKNDNSNKPTPEMTAQAVAAAKSADVVIYIGGIDSSLEAESSRVDYQGFLNGDRARIELPPVQDGLARGVAGDRQAGGVCQLQRQRDGHAVGDGHLPRSCRRGIRASKADAPWPRFCSATWIPPAVCR
jgi:hypothetical protein